MIIRIMTGYRGDSVASNLKLVMPLKLRAALAYGAAIFVPLAIAVGWHEVSPTLQAIPGYVYLLVVALLARFVGFGPTIAFTLTSAAALGLYVLPLAFGERAPAFFLLRLL